MDTTMHRTCSQQVITSKLIGETFKDFLFMNFILLPGHQILFVVLKTRSLWHHQDPHRNHRIDRLRPTATHCCWLTATTTRYRHASVNCTSKTTNRTLQLQSRKPALVQSFNSPRLHSETSATKASTRRPSKFNPSTSVLHNRRKSKSLTHFQRHQSHQTACTYPKQTITRFSGINTRRENMHLYRVEVITKKSWKIVKQSKKIVAEWSLVAPR